jgi:hypothetical protein
MNALLKISLLSILAFAAFQTANASQLVAKSRGVEIWESGTPGDYTFEFRNRNRTATADIDFVLDGEEQSISVEAQGRESVTSSEDEPYFRLVRVSLSQD